jgi:hypothetical protein
VAVQVQQAIALQVMGQQFAAADTIDDVIGGMERAVRADWHSTWSDAPELAVTSPSWFPGQHQHLSLSGFELRCCGDGWVARVAQAAAAAGLRLRLELKLGACRLARATSAAAAAGGGWWRRLVAAGGRVRRWDQWWRRGTWSASVNAASWWRVLLGTQEVRDACIT